MPAVLTLLISLCSFMAFGAEKLAVTGDVYDLSGQKKLYEYKRFVDAGPEATTLRNEYKDLNGKLAVKEKAEMQKGTLKTYTVEHKQTKESGTILVRDNKVLFSHTNAAGKTSTSVETLNKDFVVGMTLIPFMKKHWASLLKGNTHKTRFGVWHRAETVGFKIWKEAEKVVNGKNLVTVVMKPTSLVIRALVDPVYFTFDKATKKLVELKGRTQPKIKKGTAWADLDALIKYQNK